jgi:hypothetical protein
MLQIDLPGLAEILILQHEEYRCLSKKLLLFSFNVCSNASRSEDSGPQAGAWLRAGGRSSGGGSPLEKSRGGSSGPGEGAPVQEGERGAALVLAPSERSPAFSQKPFSKQAALVRAPKSKEHFAAHDALESSQRDLPDSHSFALPPDLRKSPRNLDRSQDCVGMAVGED